MIYGLLVNWSTGLLEFCAHYVVTDSIMDDDELTIDNDLIGNL